MGLRQTRPLICPQDVYIQAGETIKLQIHKKMSTFRMNAVTKIMRVNGMQNDTEVVGMVELVKGKSACLEVVLSCDLNDKEKPA